MTMPRATVRSYRDLLVWQRSLDIALRIYDATAPFPRSELYGLVAQMRRAAVSIPSNIAEGHGRHHLGEYLHHLSIANGSLMELETQVIVSSRRRYLSEKEVRALLASCAEVGRMLAGLTRALSRGRAASG
ncbi:MAG TPA: four helix bundle protein [Gemmatimonadales bacterium]